MTKSTSIRTTTTPRTRKPSPPWKNPGWSACSQAAGSRNCPISTSFWTHRPPILGGSSSISTARTIPSSLGAATDSLIHPPLRFASSNPFQGPRPLSSFCGHGLFSLKPPVLYLLCVVPKRGLAFLGKVLRTDALRSGPISALPLCGFAPSNPFWGPRPLSSSLGHGPFSL